jgi:glycosyltransferase involved in cell wall biosynthesis
MTDEARRILRVLQVATSDGAGGAQAIARALMDGLRERGHRCWTAVGERVGSDPDVLELRRLAPAWTRFWSGIADGRRERYGPIARAARVLADPRGVADRRRGLQNPRLAGSGRVLGLPPEAPDVLHCHNLHGTDAGAYFDLRALGELSRRVPTVVTLHDAWLLSGHCAHPLACERWRTGCGSCPDLTLPPAVRADRTDVNWLRKREAFARCRLHAAAPSHWLMRKVEGSMLMPGLVETRVIPHGVDLGVFAPGDRAAARAALGLPTGADVLLMSASGHRANPWKDHATAMSAIRSMGPRQRPLIFLVLGEDAPDERHGGVEVRHLAFVADPARVALHCRAADAYLHAARVDTFPTAVLEALACGVPVVASRVGGIPEQVDEGATGLLVPPGDAQAMASACTRLLDDRALRVAMGEAARTAAVRRFDVREMLARYLGWYDSLVAPRP